MAIKKFQQWLNDKDMDTDAIEEDISNGDEESNIKEDNNLFIYRKVKIFFTALTFKYQKEHPLLIKTIIPFASSNEKRKQKRTNVLPKNPFLSTNVRKRSCL